MDSYLEVLLKYAAFNGRSRRREYWEFTLINLAVLLALIVLDLLLVGSIGWYPFLSPIYYLLVLVPTLAVTCRRLHDIGVSGMAMFLNLVPYLGPLILFVMLIRDSRPGPNVYGVNPKEDPVGSLRDAIGDRAEGSQRLAGMYPVQAAVAGAVLGLLFVSAGFYLPFSQFGVDPISKELRLGGGLDNWRRNSGFLFLVGLSIFFGLGLMFASLHLARGQERKSQRTRQVVYGLNAVVGTVLVAIVLAVLNLLAFTDPIDQLTGRAFSRDFDWTRGTMYTLQPRTVAYLNELQEPVKAYSFLDTDDPGYTEMTALLRNAQAQSRRFTWERLTVAPRAEPKALQLRDKYNLKNPAGGVLVVAGDENGKHDHEFIPHDKITRPAAMDFGARQRSNRVTFSGENALLGAMSSLLEGNVVVYFTQGHGEPALDGAAMGGRRAAPGLSALRERLTENRRRFQVRPLTFEPGMKKVPDDATAVVIVRPTQAFADFETKVLGEYLARKGETAADRTVKVAAGRLMVLLDPIVQKAGGGAAGFVPTGLEGFLAGYGVSLPNERVQLATNPDDPLRVDAIIDPESNNPLNEAFNRVDVGRGLVAVQPFTFDGLRVVRAAKESKGPYRAEVLMDAATRGVWVEKELTLDPGARAAAILNDGEMQRKLLARGPVPAAVVVSGTGGGPKAPGMPDDAAHGGGQGGPLLAVFGSASWVMNSGLSGPTGALRADLFSSTLSWLRGQGEMGKFVDDKTNQEYELGVPPQNMSRLRVLPLVLMALAVVGLGAGVWVVRRR